ncbi:MAG: nucleotidyltransferase domain-containing protein [Thermoplasmata archaeon]
MARTPILMNVERVAGGTMEEPAFESLDWLRDVMAEFPNRWYVAGGWAIDLAVGRVTRPHADVEIAILRRDQEAIRSHLTDWEFYLAVPGKRGIREPWEEGSRLELPIHEVYAASPDGTELEILLNESTGGVWRFRRMMEIARPLSKMGRLSTIGLPYLAPEIVLLYKAKEPRAIDEEDFRVARPLLAEEAGEWLRISIDACYPDHHWLASFDEHVQ